MNAEELGFFNRQLAGMLRAGIPLEGSLRKLCGTMPESKMRSELQALEADLAKGTPLADAVKKRELPEMYVRMVTAGAASGDLPGVLIQFADYCEQRHSLSRRLRGMMTYPLIVLSVSFALSILLAFFFQAMLATNTELIEHLGNARIWTTPSGRTFVLWVIPLIIGIIWGFFFLLTFVPGVRRKWQWRLPGLRETCLAQLAAMLQIQIRAGVPLSDALGTVELMEQGSVVADEVAGWREHLAKGGNGIPPEAIRNKSVPPLFRWMIRQSGEDLADGLAQTAKFYADRSEYRSETFLYAALPVSILFLGGVVIMQFSPLFFLITRFLDMLGDWS